MADQLSTVDLDTLEHENPLDLARRVIEQYELIRLYAADVDTMNRHIAQLERVRLAAQELLDVTAGFQPVREEHQALGTILDELRLTENDAAPKAG